MAGLHDTSKIKRTTLDERALKPKSAWRTSAVAMLFGLLVPGVLLLVVPDKRKMLIALDQTRWHLMLLAVACLALAVLSDAGRLWWMCRGLGQAIPYLKVVQAIKAANSVSLVTPFVSGGAPCIVWVLKQSGISTSMASAAVVAGGLVSQSTLVTLSILIPLVSGISRAEDAFSKLLWTATLAVVPLYLFGVLVVLMSSLKIHRLERYIRRAVDRLSSVKRARALASRAASLLNSICLGLHDYRASFNILAMERPAVLIRAYLFSAGYFMMLFTVGYITLLALGVRADYLEVVAAQVLILLAASATPTPGGAGATEFGAYSLFTLLVPPEVVAVFIVLWRLLSYWLLLFSGSVAFALAVRTQAALSREDLTQNPEDA